MTYETEQAGKPDFGPSIGVSGTASDLMTFAIVQDRLVDAVRHWWRSRDADAGFAIRGRISSVWQRALSDPAFIDIKEAELRPLPLSRGDIARMHEATDWILHVPERDRRMVILALRKLAGGTDQVPWLKVWNMVGRGRPGPDGLRMRYGRAITSICHALNGADFRNHGESR